MQKILLTALLAVGASAETPAWTQFRGPKFDNNFPDQHLPADFGPGTNVAWKTEVPSGQGSLCIVGDTIFLTAFDGKDTLETLALDRRDGAVRWRRPIKPEKLEPFFQKLGTPASSTCSSDGHHVLTYFGSFGLVCYDLAGKEQWRAPLPLPQTKDGFGSGTSPVIHKGLVYLLRDEDGPGQGLYAFDVKNGREVWKRKRDGFRVSFGSPVVWDDSLVVIGDLRAKAYDLKTGEDRWVVRGLASYPCTTPAPGSDGNLYIATWSNGSSNERNLPEWKDFLTMMDKDKDGKLSKTDAEGTFMADFFVLFDKNKNGFVDPEEWQDSLDFMSRGQNAVLAIKPHGRGDITDTHVIWKNDKGAPYVASPLFYDGHLYLIKDGGLLTVYEGGTGKLLVDRQRLGVPGDYYSSPIAAGGKIYIVAGSGVLITVKPGAAPEVLAKADLGEPVSSTPAVMDNTLYLRTGSHVWAFRNPSNN